MRRIPGLVLLILLPCGALAANTQARLVLEAAVARPGDTVLAGIHFKMAPGWHIYWRNAGDSGGAPEIRWKLPPGVSAGEPRWPVPQRHEAYDLHTFVYYDETMLVVPLTLSETLAPGTLALGAELEWLECEKLCIPGSGSVSAGLSIGGESVPGAEAGLIRMWQERLPKRETPPGARAWWGGTEAGDMRPLSIEWKSVSGQADFFPFEHGEFHVGAGVERVRSPEGSVRLRTVVRRFGGESSWPESIAGVLVEGGRGDGGAYEVALGIGAAPAERAGLPLMLLFGFLGGIILNIMPCVLPVVSLKILGFVNQGGEAGGVRRLGLAYTAGVAASFLVLAGVVIGIQRAGEAASWGMQFQNPQFLVLMTVLLTLVALNLFGVFEINAGGRTLSAAGALAQKQGAGGAFFHGVLITILSTPCTAPFLGVALGFAFTQPPVTILLMFGAVAMGLALPYLVLSFKPGWGRFLPKPGAWMERFKIAMGFPMIATAVWIFSLAMEHFGEGGALWLGLFLVVLALSAWVWGEFVQRAGRRRGVAMAASAGLLLAGYLFALELQLNWRSPGAAGGIVWEPWTPAAVEEARAAGHPVLVDFTARWCLNCRVNKLTSIDVKAVRRRIQEAGVRTFIADFTHKDPKIAEELRRHGRAGVPLVLVYSPDLDEPPEILPELLTRGIVLGALERAR